MSLHKERLKVFIEANLFYTPKYVDILMHEEETPEAKDNTPPTHKFYDFAFDIINGKGGGEYFYSLEEDYVYIYENGYWRQLFDIEFLDKVEEAIPYLKKYNLPMKEQIIKQFKYKKFLRIEAINKFPLINFENYMYDPLGNNVLAHNKDFHSTVRIPYKYNALAKCPLWDKTLLEIFEGDKLKVDLLQEFFGYCLMPDNNQKKALLLLGDTDTGKSTILFLLADLLGEVNCSSVPLHNLSNPQYTPLLINKIVNIDADVNKTAGDYEREFKVITSGEPLTCNQKHIPTFKFIPKCKIVLAANIFPRITDHSSAFYQRLIVIPCDRRFSEEEKNRQLRFQLKEELPGIFNWCVEGLNRFRKRGQFERHDFMIEAVQELEDENNPSNMFFNEHLEVELGDGVYIEKGELFDRYKDWCFKNKQLNLTSIQFSRCVYKRFHKTTPKGSRHSEGKRPLIWKNIRYVQFKTGITKQEINWQDPPAVAVHKTASPTTIAADSQQGIIDWGE